MDLPSGLNDRDFAEFQRVAKESSGIILPASKRPMVYTRFIRRLKELNICSFQEYLDLVKAPFSREHESFVNTLTTNLTYFFRESDHFEFLKSHVLPDVFRNRTDARPVRFWSAGCSYGPEPYSIAMTLCEDKKMGGADYRILCTDIDSQMVQATANGCFAKDRTRGLSSAQIDQWFTLDKNQQLRAKPELQAGMIWKKLNLFDSWPIRSGVDVIFCRNVLIYFDRSSQKRIISSFASIQNSKQYLFLGHSESLRGFEDCYRQVANTVYQRL